VALTQRESSWSTASITISERARRALSSSKGSR
jgi:hypothetical protein